ncbi:MAG: hypothetical protein HZB92_05590 [Euryarchaeota archaeon]|nr:hypothetical protein [Euryarchaeota archaeon]
MPDLPRIPTGVPGLDALLEGGLAPGSFCMIEGDPMSATHYLVLACAAAGLAADEGCTFLCTKEFGETVAQEIGAQGVSVAKRLSVVDTYSFQIDSNVHDTDMIQYVSSVSDMPKLSHVVISAMSKHYSSGIMQQRLLIESVDTMAMYVPMQAVYRFLFFLKAKVKAFKGIGIFVYTSAVEGSNDRTMLIELADALVRLSSADDSVKVTIPARGTRSGKYSFSDDRLDIMPFGMRMK